jgi:hypothetical protein
MIVKQTRREYNQKHEIPYEGPTGAFQVGRYCSCILLCGKSACFALLVDVLVPAQCNLSLQLYAS